MLTAIENEIRLTNQLDADYKAANGRAFTADERGTLRTIYTSLQGLKTRLETLNSATLAREKQAQQLDQTEQVQTRLFWGLTAEEISRELALDLATVQSLTPKEPIDFASMTDAEAVSVLKARLRAEKLREYAFNSGRLRNALQHQIRTVLAQLELLLTNVGRIYPAIPPVWINGGGATLEAKLAAAFAEVTALIKAIDE